MGEIHLLAQDYAGGEHILREAVRCLNKVDDFDCSGLIGGCEELLKIAVANQKKQQGGGASSSSSSAGASSSSSR